MLVEHGLDLVGGDVLAAPDDHVAVAAGQEQVAVLVDIPGIPGVKPPTTKGLGRRFRPLPVPLHDQFALHQDLAVVRDLDLDALESGSHRLQLHALGRVGRDHRRGFGLAHVPVDIRQPVGEEAGAHDERPFVAQRATEGSRTRKGIAPGGAAGLQTR